MTNTTDHGTVQYNGIKVSLTQQAYLNYDSINGNHYAASGKDAAGNIYSIVWDVLAEDCAEDEACDWDDYTVALA